MQVTDYNSLDSILQISGGIFGYATSKLPFLANHEKFVENEHSLAMVMDKFYDLFVVLLNLALIYYAMMIASRCKNNKFIEFLFAICFSLPYILVREFIMKCSTK